MNRLNTRRPPFRPSTVRLPSSAAAAGVLVLAILAGGIGAEPVTTAHAERGTGIGRNLTAAEVQAVGGAAGACPSMTAARLAGQLAADRTGQQLLSTDVWNRWAPWPDADRTDPDAAVQALAHHMCHLVGELRVAGMTGDRWQLALAAHVAGVAAVRAAGGIPASARDYVETVERNAGWFRARLPQPGTPAPSVPSASLPPSPSAPAPSARPTTARPPTAAPSSAAPPAVPPVPSVSVSPPRLPGNEATRCSGNIRVGDVVVHVCWVWKYLGGAYKLWRPVEFQLKAQETGKPLNVHIATSAENQPSEIDLGRVAGNRTWRVPATYTWDMTSGVESTTTSVARRLGGRTTDCVVKFRHQPTDLFVLGVSGSC